jgi:hypothetical protein
MAEPEYANIINPFESTFSLLQGMQQEISGLRDALAQVKEERIYDVNALKIQVQDLRDDSVSAFQELHQHIQEIVQERHEKIEVLEAQVHEIASKDISQMEQNRLKLAKEVDDRRVSCMAINKKLGIEATQWRSRCEKIEKSVVENRKMVDMFVKKAKERHEDLVIEVGRHATALLDNSMAIDPFRHFAPFRSSASAGAGANAVNLLREEGQSRQSQPCELETFQSSTQDNIDVLDSKEKAPDNSNMGNSDALDNEGQIHESSSMGNIVAPVSDEKLQGDVGNEFIAHADVTQSGGEINGESVDGKGDATNNGRDDVSVSAS